MKKKQLIAFASAMALAVTSLAGCGKSEDSTQKEAVSEAEGTALKDSFFAVRRPQNRHAGSFNLY